MRGRRPGGRVNNIGPSNPFTVLQEIHLYDTTLDNPRESGNRKVEPSLPERT